MNFIPTAISDVWILEPRVFDDKRGFFYESWSQKVFDEHIPNVTFVQDNISKSSYGVVRGLHFQKGEHAQAKLVHVLSGRVLDVAVDVRKGSPTFGQHVAVELTSENHRQLFVPRGFAHGFSVLSETALFQYKCDNFYCPESEGGIAWNDPALNIQWRIDSHDIILSPKDERHPCLNEAPELFDYPYSPFEK